MKKIVFEYFLHTSLVGHCYCASAAIRPPIEDATLVERSEIIVVAHQMRIREIGDLNSQRHYYASVKVDRVLKGAFKGEDLPLVIHYGLLPVRIRQSGQTALSIEHRSPAVLGVSMDRLEIFDTLSSARGGPPVVPDALGKNIWFLRRLDVHDRAGNLLSRGEFGIADPHDVQMVALEPYLGAYLAENPEASVRRHIERNPVSRERGQRFLEHKQVERVSRIIDPIRRADELIPYIASNAHWDGQCEAAVSLVACGPEAASHLLPLLNNNGSKAVRLAVIDLMSETRCLKSVDPLINILRSHEMFLTKQKFPEIRIVHLGPEPSETQMLDEVYEEDIHIIQALGRIGDRGATETLIATRRSWANIKIADPQIVSECDRSITLFK